MKTSLLLVVLLASTSTAHASDQTALLEELGAIQSDEGTVEYHNINEVKDSVGNPIRASIRMPEKTPSSFSRALVPATVAVKVDNGTVACTNGCRVRFALDGGKPGNLVARHPRNLGDQTMYDIALVDVTYLKKPFETIRAGKRLVVAIPLTVEGLTAFEFDLTRPL